MSASQEAASIAKPQSASFLSTLFNHPAGFWFIFWGEFAERASYYGVLSLLATYMVERLDLSRQDGGTYVSVFMAACYFLPLVGGFIADNYFGKYNTIVFFSVPYILGHFVLGYENKVCLFAALALLAMGSGVIKPNISTLMGMTYDQFRPGLEQLRSNAFSMFYMSINIGAAVTQIMVPWIRTRYNSYWMAFLFPAVLMVFAFIAFAVGKPFYAKEVITRTRRTPEERALQWKVIGQLSGLFLLCMFFWGVFNQTTHTWIYFAQTYMECNVGGWEFDPEQVQALNAFFIIALLPILAVLWTYLAAKGMPVRPTTKMILGFLVTAGCMGTMAAAGYTTGQAEKRDMVKDGAIVRDDAGAPKQVDFLPPERKVSVLWQVAAYFFLTVAEILISVTGLELAFVAAPKSMKSFITSLWLLTIGLANLLLNVPLSRVYPTMHPGHYFAMLTGVLIVVSALFYLIARRFNRLMDEQDEEAKRQKLRSVGQEGPGSTADLTHGIQDKSRREGITGSDQQNS